jgi:uncharacterized protein YneF (UPF0154 family)
MSLVEVTDDGRTRGYFNSRFVQIKKILKMKRPPVIALLVRAVFLQNDNKSVEAQYDQMLKLNMIKVRSNVVRSLIIFMVLR